MPVRAFVDERTAPIVEMMTPPPASSGDGPQDGGFDGRSDQTSYPFTVADLLRIPELAVGYPEVMTGDDGLNVAVRWVHVSELPDVAVLLSGGEVILTTGIALSEESHALSAYVEDLAAADAVGLIVELGRRFDQIPMPALLAAKRVHLPLVALTKPVRFVSVTEAAHNRIQSSQLSRLRRRDTIHAVFDELAVEGAPTERIVRVAAELLGLPVVLENLTHQVLALDAAGLRISPVLHDWEWRSRAARTLPGIAHARVGSEEGSQDWLTASVGARGEQWGRLVCLGAHGTDEQRTVLQSAATATALSRIAAPDWLSLERRSQGTLLDEIRSGSYGSGAELLVRSAAVGVPLTGTSMSAVVVRVHERNHAPQHGSDDLKRRRAASDGDRVASAARASTAPALVGVLPDGDIALLVPHKSAQRRVALTALTRALHRSFEVIGLTAHIGVGTSVSAVRDARRSLREAEQVVDTIGGLDQGKLYYELSDVRLQGLLHVLRDDPRLQSFVERELGPLLAHDQERRTDYMEALRTYLKEGRNKSSAADALHMSRPAFYQRLSRIEEILSVDLADVASCLSLHVAICALESVRRQPRHP